MLVGATEGLQAVLDARARPTRAGRALIVASSMHGAAQGSRLLLIPARGAESKRDIARQEIKVFREWSRKGYATVYQNSTKAVLTLLGIE